MQPLVLASRSPQRSAILTQLGITFEAAPAGIEEEAVGDAAAVVRANALAKANAVAAGRPGELVLGCDTEVLLDGRLFGKAESDDAAREMLAALSGRTHQVWSGIALVGPEPGAERSATAVTAVSFRALDGPALDWYMAGGEWRERAGAYAIQGRGAALVASIEGDYWNVVGLPVATLLELAPELLG